MHLLLVFHKRIMFNQDSWSDKHNFILFHSGATQGKRHSQENDKYSCVQSDGKPLNDVTSGCDDAANGEVVDKKMNGRAETKSDGEVGEGVSTPRVTAKRWLILSLFCAYSFTNAFQWIHLNIIGNLIYRYYNESLPGTPYQKQVWQSKSEWTIVKYMK